MAGKDVVQLYAQTPYTDYDKENNVEKASESSSSSTGSASPDSFTISSSFRSAIVPSSAAFCIPAGPLRNSAGDETDGD